MSIRKVISRSIQDNTVAAADFQGAVSSLSNAGNLTFSSTGQRILGDFGNSTVSNRIYLQTTITNDNTAVGVIPNGTAAISALNLVNNSDPTNSSFLQVGARAAEVSIRSSIFGTGTYLPLTMYTNNAERLRIDTSGNVGIGTNNPTARLDVRRSTTDGLIAEFHQSSGYGIDIGSSESVATISSGYLQALTFRTDPSSGQTERMRIDSAGQVIVGPFGGNGNAVVAGSSSPSFTNQPGTNLLLKSGDGSGTGSSFMTFSTSPAGSSGTTVNTAVERMRINSSGHVFVGTTTDPGSTTKGAALYASGVSFFSAISQPVVYANRITDDGVIIEFQRSGTVVGSIGTNGGSPSRVYITGGDTGLDFEASTDAIRPCSGAGGGRDNVIDFGRPDVRFRTAYITNGVVTGSDLNDKQDIEVLNEAETRVAIACKGLLRKWRWKDSVAEKGNSARTHFGIIAQDLKAAFEAEGLDAGKYSMFIWNEWWETSETYINQNGLEKVRINTYQKQEDAPEGAIRKERMGIQYSELLAFMIAVL
jgi:hypothetical protein